MSLKYIKKSIYLLAATVLTITSCSKDFLDVNTDPITPTEGSVKTLLPRAEQFITFSLGFSRGNTEVGLGEVLAVYTHQMVVRETPDQYGAVGSEFNINGAWRSFYSSALPDLEQIITAGTADGNMKYVGIAKILKAYGFSQFVDVFGDIPFSETVKFSEGLSYPKFEDDETIYPSLIAMIDEGIADLNADAANNLEPGTDDIIYKGNVQSWIKAANTIKLKLYNQIRLTRNVSAEVTALLANSNNLIGATSESFMYSFGAGITPDDRNPAFGDYVATQKSRYLSPWFYEIMKGYRGEVFKNNEDPRIPYYWYKQIKPTTETANPTEYRDGGFVSILFGSVGPNRDFSVDNTVTVFGIYPAGGRFDDNGGTPISGTSGTGAAPYRFLTYADRLYIEAELIKTGVIPGDAKAKLREAIVESFKMVDFVVTKAALASQTVPTLNGTAAVTTYIDKVLAEYDSKNDAGKLQIIMTQKWIQNFGNHPDQYTDYRRTGYPILFNPNDNTQAPGGFYQPPVDGNSTVDGDQPAVRVQLTREYPLSLPWAQDELERNLNAPAQKQPSSSRVFWDVD